MTSICNFWWKSQSSAIYFIVRRMESLYIFNAYPRISSFVTECFINSHFCDVLTFSMVVTTSFIVTFSVFFNCSPSFSKRLLVFPTCNLRVFTCPGRNLFLILIVTFFALPLVFISQKINMRVTYTPSCFVLWPEILYLVFVFLH